ncbi:MAG TPA: hypothetical protein VFB61_12490 [Gemmatimonadales bacterium]|nr:hypothetical protein [Gemmatimonadales bacterium]
MTEFTSLEQLRWSWLYAAATLAGACLGLLVLLGLLPSIPAQLTSWIRSVDPEVAVLTLVLGGALIGFSLTAVAHLGVRWQLSRRSRTDPE